MVLIANRVRSAIVSALDPAAEHALGEKSLQERIP